MRSCSAEKSWGPQCSEATNGRTSCDTDVLQIGPSQWRTLTELCFRRTEADIALALRRRFENSSEERIAISIQTLSDDELAGFVHEIVEVGRKHGFELRGDLYSLVEAVAIFGRENALLDAMLTNEQLSPQEKVSVIVDFCEHLRSFRPIASP